MTMTIFRDSIYLCLQQLLSFLALFSHWNIIVLVIPVRSVSLDLYIHCRVYTSMFFSCCYIFFVLKHVHNICPFFDNDIIQLCVCVREPVRLRHPINITLVHI